MTITNARVAIQEEPAKSIPENTIIDSSAPYPMNFEIPMGALQFWEFVPTARWSITHEHRITQHQSRGASRENFTFGEEAMVSWGLLLIQAANTIRKTTSNQIRTPRKIWHFGNTREGVRSDLIRTTEGHLMTDDIEAEGSATPGRRSPPHPTGPPPLP
jgi:hypothetical protein